MKPVPIELIWAQSNDPTPVIGVDGKLPWHLSEDLRHFKQVTEGRTIVMGRKTWDSLPVRPLRGRINVVISRGQTGEDRLNHTLRQLSRKLSHNHSHRKIIVIGGGEIYRQTIDFATRLHVTEVNIKLGAGVDQAYAPPIDSSWSLAHGGSKSDIAWQPSASGLYYRFLTYERPPDRAQSITYT